MILETLVVGALETNCYIVGAAQSGRAIVIDPGDEPSEILRTLQRRGLALDGLIATHAHFDHILAVRALQEASGAPFYLNAADRPLLQAMQRTAMAWIERDPGEPPEVDGDLIPGEAIQVGDLALEIRGTPGHSPGGIALVHHESRRAFTGDAVFAGSIGRTDMPGGNMALLMESIRTQILSLPDDYTLLPGHGPSSTVLAERMGNPFLNVAWRSVY
jgi:hydroxyacylglutathione hydrolase